MPLRTKTINTTFANTNSTTEVVEEKEKLVILNIRECTPTYKKKKRRSTK